MTLLHGDGIAILTQSVKVRFLSPDLDPGNWPLFPGSSNSDIWDGAPDQT